MKKINDYIYYIDEEINPVLSAQVFIIKSKSNTYIYDVGASINSLIILNNIENKNIIISHFHKDHIDNITKLSYKNLYVSKYTYKHINQGTIILNKKIINDGDLKLEIEEIPSSHAKGCLSLNVNNEYLFVGDAIYSKVIDNRSAYNVSLLYDLIKYISNIDAKYIVISHKRKLIIKKNILLEYLKLIYKNKNSKSAIIYL